MGLGLGEGGVVAAGATDQGAAGAAASGRQQVAAGAAVEVGRAGQAADQPVRAAFAVDPVAAGPGLDQVFLGPAVDDVVAGPAARRTKSTAASEPSTRRLSLPGPRSAISQRAGPFDRAERLLRVAAGRSAASGAECDRPWSRRRRRSPIPVEGDRRDMVGAAAADDLQAAAAAADPVEFDVGAGLRRRFGAAGDGAPLRPATAVAALTAVEFVAAAATSKRVVAGTAIDRVGLLVADQRVGEGRAFDALEAEEPVVAVAVAPCGPPARPRRRPPPRRPVPDVGREGGDVAAARAAVHAVVAVVAVDEVVVAGTAVERVDAEAAADLVGVPRAAE